MNRPEPSPTHHTTFQAAQLLGLAVRSVQLMVERGELQAWKTQGGHRRISHESLLRWISEHPQHKKGLLASQRAADLPGPPPTASRPPRQPRVLLIEDSVHYQQLIRRLMRAQFPEVELHVANEGFSGLALFGALSPDVLLLEVMLPGIEGATLMGALRSHPTFERAHLIVVTAMAAAELHPHRPPLRDLRVVHKTELLNRLPDELGHVLGLCQAAVAA